MNYVINTDKVDEIDFLTGNHRYKQDWMSDRRERWGLDCVNRPEPKSRSASMRAFMQRILAKIKR